MMPHLFLTTQTSLSQSTQPTVPTHVLFQFRRQPPCPCRPHEGTQCVISCRPGRPRECSRWKWWWFQKAITFAVNVVVPSTLSRKDSVAFSIRGGEDLP